MWTGRSLVALFGASLSIRAATRRPRIAVIITSDQDLAAGEPIRVAVISSNLKMTTEENMVLLPYANSIHGHIHTRLKKKCAAICNWLEHIAEEKITRYDGWVRGKWMFEIMERVNELDKGA